MVEGGARGRTAPAAAVLENPNATLPPGTPLREIPKPGTPLALEAESEPVPPKRAKAAPAAAVEPAPAAPSLPPGVATAESVQALLEEVRSLRRTQDEILALLRALPSRPVSAPAADDGDPFGFAGDLDTPMSVPAVTAPLRSRKRKSVLLVDDDAKTRALATAAFEKAEVPVRAVGDGNSALSALADDKSDVLVLELGMGGAMAAKDVVNMIKATMEWVDIPIVLYTRMPVASQKEARQIHGADEIVPKEPGSEEALVARVIQIFRRG
jgi:CheY-like chemotaxis protein